MSNVRPERAEGKLNTSPLYIYSGHLTDLAGIKLLELIDGQGDVHNILPDLPIIGLIDRHRALNIATHSATAGLALLDGSFGAATIRPRPARSFYEHES